jgi:hypothetical protein
LPELGKLGARNEGQDHISRESFLDSRLDSKSVGSVNKDASMLRGDHRINDGSEIVDVRQGFDAKNDVVERTVAADGSLFCVSNNW